MNPVKWILIGCCIAAMLALAGCGSSEESNKESTPPPAASKPPEQVTKPEAAVPPKVDTVNVVNVQTAPKPTYEQNAQTQQSTQPSSQTGTFAVQIGAYKTEENAQRAASLAKDRFGLAIQTISDKTDLLFKVMVGSFMTRDDARKFRDDITQKYPLDYKDAWVKDMSQK
jgi:cell division septation protein DedD